MLHDSVAASILTQSHAEMLRAPKGWNCICHTSRSKAIYGVKNVSSASLWQPPISECEKSNCLASVEEGGMWCEERSAPSCFSSPNRFDPILSQLPLPRGRTNGRRYQGYRFSLLLQALFHFLAHMRVTFRLRG